MKEIYLAGGCFWGLQKYLDNIKGITMTEVGYANGNTSNPTYEEVCGEDTGFAEVVKVIYDSNQIKLKTILKFFIDAIDPTSFNKQGEDEGEQYRTGIYYKEQADKEIIINYIDSIRKNYKKELELEILPLNNYYKAEEYHQKYLTKKRGGYCHISDEQIKKAKDLSERYSIMYDGDTEIPFENAYYDNFKKGIYVDPVNGKPLFISTDKFEANCGWPSFSKPVEEEALEYLEDESGNMNRIEVRTTISDIHLGHVFPDGPEELGGHRYCINSASLRFIPLEKMKEEGYSKYIKLIK